MRKYILIILTLSQVLAWADPAGVQPVRVGLLLPLQTDVQQRNWNIDRFADFYTGALLAVYEMQSRQFPVEVYTYDVGKSESQLQAVLSTSQLDSVDCIIGPAYPQQVHAMSEWSYEHGIHTLLPFSSEVPELMQNPYLLQFNSSVEKDAEVMARYLSNLQPTVRCIFVQADSTQIPESVSMLQQYIIEEGVEVRYTTIRHIMNDSLYLALSDTAENVLLMNTERYANIRQIMPQLMRAAQGRQLTLLSRYSWQNERIALPQIYSTVFLHDEQPYLQCYDSIYQQFVLPPRIQSRPCYDLLGHDMMMYMLLTVHAMRESHQDWESEDIVGRPYNGVQSNVRFEKVSVDGGYYNANIQIIRK